MNTLERLQFRAAFFRVIRRFFEERGFLEVVTPVRQPVMLPERHILPIEAEGQFLQTSPELAMKGLVAAGCQRIFQICPCFRKNEIGRLHREEFLMLEWYRAHSTYCELLTDCEALLTWLASDLDIFQGFDLTSPWQRLTVEEAFSRYSPLALAEACEKNLFEEVLVNHVEPQLGLAAPCILYDYPLQLGSLAAPKKENPAMVERFEMYLGGVELANGCTELIDAREQRRRFAAELAAIKEIYCRDSEMPEAFLGDLEKMPPTAGVAVGCNRLLMVALGEQEIAL
jgi:lysyl-tRNA synthetase class 2